jgi:hypothetical protein
MHHPSAFPCKYRQPSIKTFRNYLTVFPDGQIDASRVISRECFLEFLELKSSKESRDEAERFYRILTNHISGTDGRKPFHKVEEAAILQVLRKTLTWPFCPQMERKFRGIGFHERTQAVANVENTKRMRIEPLPLRPVAMTKYRLNEAGMMVLNPNWVEDGCESDDTEPCSPPNELATTSPPTPPAAVVAMTVTHVVRNILHPLLVEVGKLTCLNEETWRQVMEMFRVYLVKHTKMLFTSATTEYANQLCNSMSSGTDAAVIVEDFSYPIKHLRKRVEAQNETSKLMFGVLKGVEMGLVELEDLNEWLVAVFTCFCCPEKPLVFQQNLCILGGPHVMVKVKVPVTYIVERESLLLVSVIPRVSFVATMAT